MMVSITPDGVLLVGVLLGFVVGVLLAVLVRKL